MKNFFNLLTDFIICVFVIFILWLGISFFEVNSKNKMPNPEYTKYNAFVLMTK